MDNDNLGTDLNRYKGTKAQKHGVRQARNLFYGNSALR